jgi:5-methyltetrahydrofolate--homocysteine methyltransferase
MDAGDLPKLTDAVARGSRNDAKQLTQALIDGGVKPDVIVDQGLVPGMAIVGERFKRNEAFVPEMLIAARAMKECMAMIEPLLIKAGFRAKFTAIIGTVEGDLHDIGKNLVAMMWRGANIKVVDVGTNAPPAKFVAAAKEHKASVIGLSALLTTTMPSMKSAVDAVRSDPDLRGVKVMIGGAPVSREFATKIGADGFAADAASAVDEAVQLVGA